MFVGENGSKYVQCSIPSEICDWNVCVDDIDYELPFCLTDSTNQLKVWSFYIVDIFESNRKL